MPTPVEWAIQPGQSLRRTELHARYGGRVQGGMTTSTSSDNLLLFTEPRVGERHGYFDGWEGDHFHYTGMGQQGDQQLRDINRSLYRHVEEGRVVRLFRAGGPTVTYLGRFRVDPDRPVYQMDAPQQGSDKLRQVLVFRLLPVDDVVRESRDDRQLPDGLSGSAAESLLAGGPSVVRQIEVEQQHVQTTTAGGRTSPYTIERREQQLVLSYKQHLEQSGRSITRLEVIPSGEANAIRNDVYDATRDNLVEAKGTGSRDAVRMALGQVLDYGRFCPSAARAVLLPSRPRPDLEDLLRRHDVSAIWPDGLEFADNASGRFT